MEIILSTPIFVCSVYLVNNISWNKNSFHDSSCIIDFASVFPRARDYRVTTGLQKISQPESGQPGSPWGELKASDCRVAVQSLWNPQKVGNPRGGPDIGTRVCQGLLVLIIAKDYEWLHRDGVIFITTFTKGCQGEVLEGTKITKITKGCQDHHLHQGLPRGGAGGHLLPKISLHEFSTARNKFELHSCVLVSTWLGLAVQPKPPNL